jgi:hypothetical protein
LRTAEQNTRSLTRRLLREGGWYEAVVASR